MKVATLIGHLMTLPMNAEILPYFDWTAEARDFEGFVQQPDAPRPLDIIYLNCGDSNNYSSWNVPEQ